MRVSAWFVLPLLLVVAPEDAHAFARAGRAIRKIFPPYHRSKPTTPTPPAALQCAGAGSGVFHACYFNGITLSEVKALADLPSVDFDWGNGSPDERVSSDMFSARFVGDFSFEAATYRFTARSDDGIRLWLDGELLIDAWVDHAETTSTASKAITAGNHQLKLEYYEAAGTASLHLSWAKAPAHVDPASVSEEALRNFRGDFGGVYIPEIKPQCPVDPVTDIHCTGNNGRVATGLVNGAFFTPHYGVYSPEQRKAIRQAYTKGLGADGKPRNYTHLPINVDCSNERGYASFYPPVDCRKTNEFLQELWDDGIYPVCFILNDGETTANLSHLDKSLCRIVVPMWEMNGPLNGDTARINEAVNFTRQQFPNSLLYIHFTPGHGSGGEPEGGWWNWVIKDGSDVWHNPPLPNPHATGFLFQSDTWDSVPDTLDRLADFTARLGGGMNGWPGGTDIVLFETDIYTKFWDGRTEAQGVSYNDQVLKYMTTGLCEGSYCGTLRGFTSGGTRYR